MRIVVRLDAERAEVEVSRDLSEVRLGDKRFPLKLVEAPGGRVEVEVGGERVVVEGWPDGRRPPPEIVLNGERFSLGLDRVEDGPVSAPARGPPPSTPVVAPVTTPAASGGGVAVLPPMPGRVVEVRVKEGDRVTQGQVLLVLEAMKMRNEIASPCDGTVRGLHVAAGANVRAHEPMLRVEPA